MLGTIVSQSDLLQRFFAADLIYLFDSFKILITGDSSGLVETITDAVSVHSIKKSEYARRITEGNLGNVTLLDHYIHVCRMC